MEVFVFGTIEEKHLTMSTVSGSSAPQHLEASLPSRASRPEETTAIATTLSPPPAPPTVGKGEEEREFGERDAAVPVLALRRMNEGDGEDFVEGGDRFRLASSSDWGIVAVSWTPDLRLRSPSPMRPFNSF